MKETTYFQEYRTEYNHKYASFVSRGAGNNYLPVTFKRTESKLIVDDEKRTIMEANSASYNMVKNIYNMASQMLNDASIMESFSEAYDKPNPIYTALPVPAIHFAREILELRGGSYNVQIQDIGAEYLDGVGINDPLHTLELYRIVDNDYHVHYVLSTSLAMLEAKSNELHNAESIRYNDDKMFGPNGVNINETTLQEFVFGLIQDYFGIDPYETINEMQCSKVLVLNSDTTDFDVLGIAVLDRINQAEANLRIGYAIMTDEEYRPY